MGRRILQKLIKRMTKRLRRIQLAEKEQQAGKAVDALLDEVRQPNPNQPNPYTDVIPLAKRTPEAGSH